MQMHEIVKIDAIAYNIPMPIPDTPCPSTYQAWRELERAGRNARDAIEAALKASDLPALAWYEVLAELAASPERRLLQHELEERLQVAQYNLSRLTDRMERAGALNRKQCPEDGRRVLLTITSAGQKMCEAMRPIHEQAIQTHVGMRLSPAEAERLSALLAKLRGAEKSAAGAGGGT